MTTFGGTVKRSGKNCRLDNVHGHIFTPRSYQVELLDIAVRQNTIVCLGTGTGKTFIAVMLIKELAHQIRRMKHTIYLVDTVPLIEQQAHVIEMHTDLAVGTYSGEQESVLWSDERWKDELRTHNVLIMTAQIFLDIILRGFVTMSDINLIVFDECHHAVKSHPYAEIMKCVDSCPSGSHPRVLGLTASILNNKCRSPAALECSLKDLEDTLHSTVETASDMIMADLYGTKPEEILLECEQYVDSTGLVQEIGSILAATLDFIVDYRVTDGDDFTDEKDPRSGAKLVLSECSHILHELGPWCAARVAQAFAKQLAKVEEYEANDTVRRFIQLAATAMRMVQKIVDDLFDNQVQTLEEFFLYMSPKVVRLIEILHEYKPDDNFTIIGDDQFSDTGSDDSDDSFHASDDDRSDDDTGTSAWSKTNNTPKNAKPSSHYVVVRRTSMGMAGESAEPIEEDGICGIVFVERKHTAFVLNKLIVELCNWDPDLYFIRSHYVTGQGVAGAVREPDSQCQKQEEVLRKFRQREINLLVSTNVLEEGVDVPKCNLVARFSLPSTYRSYVQSKGRARAASSKYYMLVDYNIAGTFKDDLRIFKGIEMVLLSHCHNRDDHSSEEITDQMEVDTLLAPYVPLKAYGSPRVTMTSAIRLVNKYCAKLPSDVFTHLTPKCYVENKLYETGLMYQARLQLPINSPIKEPIVGAEMPSKRLAQMAAALKACEILHRSGELDDHLLPIGKELIKYEDDESEWEDHELHGQARPGTTKRKQYYYKKTSMALIGRPRPEGSCCLYALNMRLTCPITEEQNTRGRVIHKPESTSRGFGIICEKMIQKVPCFPVFTRSGEVTVSIDLVADNICLSQSQLDRLAGFHRFIFNHVLRLEKSPITFDPEKAKASYVIVPTNIDGTKTIIDWGFVSLIESSSLVPNRKKFSKDVPKEKFVFDRRTFEDAVVMPSYRNIDQPQYFYVAEIRDDLNLRSPFPSPELYDTFEHYYSSKYSLEMTNLEQPLLDVDHTSARLNLLTPRYMNQKGVALPTSSAETRRAKRENLQQKQILVPELCVIHPFPASLWRKAVCIPTILYRMNYLLIAEELRVQIALEAHLGLTQPTEGFLFPSLRFGFSDIDGARDGCAFCSCSADDGKTLDIVSGDQSRQGYDEMQLNGDDDCHSVGSGSLLVNGESSMCGEINGGDGEPRRNDGSDVHLFNSEVLEELDANGVAVGRSVVRDDRLIDGDSADYCEQLNDEDVAVHPVLITHDLNSESSAKDPNVDNASLSDKIELKNDLPSNNIGAHLSSEMSHVNGSHVVDLFTDSEKTCQGGCGFHSAERLEGVVDDVVKVSCQNDITSFHEHLNKVNDCARSTGDSSSPDGRKCSHNQCKCRNCARDIFSFDAGSTYGPSPCDIIQTLTMSNANDFFNLERLETIGDSFLKFAITVYLYCTYPGIHEGKLSYLRSIQVSNYNLYKLGKKKGLPECMVAVKFEPVENWLPPGFVIKSDAVHPDLTVPISVSQNGSDGLDDDSKVRSSKAGRVDGGWSEADGNKEFLRQTSEQQRLFSQELEECTEPDEDLGASSNKILIPYNLQTQHSLPDKSIADCVEALIGCYLVTCGQRAALLFMAWLGLRVLPSNEKHQKASGTTDAPHSNGHKKLEGFGTLQLPPSPLLLHVPNATAILEHYLDGFGEFETMIEYKFRDRSYLLQAFTHASYHYNTVTDCYQRLEFLGDAILDYVITRHLYEDSTKHSPGILTDLRSALVNNNIFASLAVKWNFHKYFKAVSPQLFHVIDAFVRWQMEHNDDIIIDEEIEHDKMDEDIEIPKALGDIFESVAGAIYLDSGMSLDTVWKVYYRMMKRHIDAFIEKIPKSPVRELLELEPETAKFEKPVRTFDGKIRVTVNVVGKGSFQGIGRNYRIAKSAAAKWALKSVKSGIHTAVDYPVVYMQ